MLELRNVTKIYHSKSGNDVRALNNVSVTFPDTGMVFILGKSGCGKSTLLNVIGGLDGCDSGEFIIKGKSSKDFGGSDFDAYRNTFIGFIFQEYNILDDFSVGANIALALELQGKKATPEQINAILYQVGLLDYAKRKPNELSGGQKQRIAIARALVKDPEIIMADEPTGALDSNTGKQIFDTLKELSRSKLVIIVSHDRDFAEIYGDRIIEMSDGVIVSDVTKHHVAPVTVSSGILQMSDNLLKIQKGYQLTPKDVELINEYLRTRQTDVIVSGDQRVNDNMRSTAGISSDNTTAVFKWTDPRTIRVTPQDGRNTKFIRSRLPMKNAIKMGSSSLGHKKVRLVFTIFLSLIAFTLFGFADTMGSYDKVTAATQSIIDSGVKNASFSLGVREEAWSDGKLQYINFIDSSFNEEDVSALNKKLGVNFTPVFNGSSNMNEMIDISDNMKTNTYIDSSTAYTGTLSGFTSMSAEEISKLGFDVVGTLPANTGEIAISKLMYEQFKASGFKSRYKDEEVSADDLTMQPSGENSIIGKHITMRVGRSEYTYKITAIVDTKFEYDRYADFIPDTSGNSGSHQGGGDDEMGVMDMVMITELQNTLKFGYHCLGYVTKDDITHMSKYMEKWYNQAALIGTSVNEWNVNIKFNDMNRYVERVGKSNLIPSDKFNFFDSSKTSLSANEYLVSSDIFRELINLKYNAHDKIYELYGSSHRFSYENSLAQIIDTVTSYKFAANEVATNRQHYKDIFSNNMGRPAENDQELMDFIVERLMYENRAVLGAEYKNAIAQIFGIDLSKYPHVTDELAYEALRSPLDTVYVTESGAAVGIDEFKRALAYLTATNAIYAPDSTLITDEEFIGYFVIFDGSGYNRDDWDRFTVDMKKQISRERYASALTFIHDEFSYPGITPAEIETQASALMFTAAGGSVSEILQSLKFVTTRWDENGEKETVHSKYKLVGTFESDDTTRNLIISDTIHDDWVKIRNEEGYWYYEYAYHADGIYSFAIAPMPTNQAEIKKYVELGYDESGDLAFVLQNQVINSLDFFNEFIEMGAKIFIYVGIGFAVFSALMMMNFISTSISYKRREIGILRAVGARSSDVFKIFFSEAFIIAIINYVLSVIATIGSVILLNAMVRKEGINVTLLNFGIRQIVLMLVISVAVAAIASFLPVWNIARRKPVDAIKNT